MISHEQPTSLTAETIVSSVPTMFFSSFLHGTEMVRSTEFRRIGSTGAASFGEACLFGFIDRRCGVAGNTLILILLLGQREWHEPIYVGCLPHKASADLLRHRCRQRNQHLAAGCDFAGTQDLAPHECLSMPARVFIDKESCFPA